MDSWTQEITDELDIVPDDQVFKLSVTAKGGPILITGNLSFRGIAPGPLIIADGGTVLYNANPNRGIALNINPNGATAQVIIFFN